MEAGLHTLVIASQKGGSGKTTLSGHIAVQAELSGAGPVALIDTDPQGSLAKWWNVRQATAPAFAQVSVPDLERDIEQLRDNGFRLIVIDTPPAASLSIAEVIAHADLVIVPTRPSPHDLRAVGATVDLCDRAGKPLIFVVNAATPKAKITYEAAVALSQHGTVAPVTLHHRVDFAASMIDGRTVNEADPASRSAREIADLWVYLADRLVRMRPIGDTAPAGLRPNFEAELLTPGSVPEGAWEETPEMALETAVPMPDAHVLAAKPAADAAAQDWDGGDRRKTDDGAPASFRERRRPPVMFGRRVDRPSHPEKA
jgi:chromosome partitioning protein